MPRPRPKARVCAYSRRTHVNVRSEATQTRLANAARASISIPHGRVFR
jgi:hypothetical protein